MSKLPIDVKQFKKIKSDGISTTLRHTKDGHEIQLSHGSLSPEIRSQLSSLPVHMFAYGGDAEQNSTPMPDSSDLSDIQVDQPTSSATPEESAKDGFKQAIKTPEFESAAKDAVIEGEGLPPDFGPQSPPPVQKPAQPENPDPFGFNSYEQGLSKSYGQQLAGQTEQLQARGQEGQDVAVAQAEKAQSDQKAFQDYSAARAPIEQKSKELENWLTDHPENAHRYIDNMSTGGKIKTAIGLILGGIGSGLTHGPNMAAQFLQKQIDNDLESQRNQIGTKKGLLAHNMQEGMNARDAYQMARIQNNEMLQSALGSAAGKAQSAASLGMIKNVQGIIGLETEKMKHELAVQKMQYGAFSGNGQTSSMALEMLPADKRERVVQMPQGGIRLALTKDGAKEINEQISSIRPIFDSLDQLSSLGAGALVPGTPAAHKAEAIRAQMVPLINENAGLKRLSAEDISNINKMFSDPTKFSQLLGGGARTQAFKSFLQDKLISKMSNQLEGGYSKPQQQYSNPMEGKIARSPGKPALIMKNGQWVPYNG